jgi:penicillin-binding protein 2
LVAKCRGKLWRNLRGIKASNTFKGQIQQRNRFLQDGKYDTIAVQGEDINLTLDAELQRYGAAINKRGGIVAIEPKTGEI